MNIQPGCRVGGRIVARVDDTYVDYNFIKRRQITFVNGDVVLMPIDRPDDKVRLAEVMNG